MMSLDRTLQRLAALRRAFISGRVTMKQALLVGSVATAVTERTWISRARSVTLRRLEDEVSYYPHLQNVRPDVWALLEGGPLPDGLALAPGGRTMSGTRSASARLIITGVSTKGSSAARAERRMIFAGSWVASRAGTRFSCTRAIRS